MTGEDWIPVFKTEVRPRLGMRGSAAFGLNGGLDLGVAGVVSHRTIAAPRGGRRGGGSGCARVASAGAGRAARRSCPRSTPPPDRPSTPRQVRDNNPDPIWRPIEVDIRQLCSADEDRPLKLQVGRKWACVLCALCASAGLRRRLRCWLSGAVPCHEDRPLKLRVGPRWLEAVGSARLGRAGCGRVWWVGGPACSATSARCSSLAHPTPLGARCCCCRRQVCDHNDNGRVPHCSKAAHSNTQSAFVWVAALPQVWDYNDSGSHQLIGEVVTSLTAMRAMAPGTYVAPSYSLEGGKEQVGPGPLAPAGQAGGRYRNVIERGGRRW